MIPKLSLSHISRLRADGDEVFDGYSLDTILAEYYPTPPPYVEPQEPEGQGRADAQSRKWLEEHPSVPTDEDLERARVYMEKEWGVKREGAGEAMADGWGRSDPGVGYHDIEDWRSAVAQMKEGK